MILALSAVLAVLLRHSVANLDLSIMGAWASRQHILSFPQSRIACIRAFAEWGLKDATMLARVYAHMIPENARSVADIVSAVLSGERDVRYMPFA